jgi:GT2 family glycosyltransferase
MLKINEFAFCFLSSDVNDVIRQENMLTTIVDKYQIERWYRHDRNCGRYISFSQMINDAIDDTESEFMIFCNPKTNFTIQDIEFIIGKLSNGYCFASVVSFGFFGFSKELIRHIGMLDERFIGGEWEDNDFAVRLNYFGKASWWDYNYDSYKNTWSKSGN